MGNSIHHTGIVIQATTQEVLVRIEARGACAACNAKKLCGMGESEDKLVSVVTPAAELFRAGEEVEVSVQQQMGIKAVVIAYVVPFLLVLTALLVMLQSGVGELAAGLSALGLLGLYYVVLYLLRHRIDRDIAFDIHKIDELK